MVFKFLRPSCEPIVEERRSKEDRRTNKEDRRTKKEDRRTKKEERRFKTDDRRTKMDEIRFKTEQPRGNRKYTLGTLPAVMVGVQGWGHIPSQTRPASGPESGCVKWL